MTHSIFARIATLRRCPLRRLAPRVRRPQPPKRWPCRPFYKVGICSLLLLCAACDILEEDISDRPIEIVGPACGAELSPGEVTFRWEAVEGASGYALRVVTPSFAEAGRIVADTLLQADTLGLARSYGCRLTLEAGRYEWTVAAFNAGYETRSATLQLTVAAEPEPEEPERPEPPDDDSEEPAGETAAFTGMPIERNALHFLAGISTGEAVRRRRRCCTNSGELQSAAGGGGERPTALGAVESSRRNSIGITDSSPLP